MRKDLPPLDTAMRVVTPENIAFEYRLAGPFLRLGAFVIDRLIVAAFLAAIALVLAFIPILVPIIIPFLLLSWFVTMWFYGGLFETYWNGTTPGKVAMGIRAISVDGRPITAMQAIVRNLLRYADFMPLIPMGFFVGVEGGWPIPTGAVGLAAMMFTHNYRRLGDLVCGTMVVVEQREWAPDVIHVETPEVVHLASQLPGDFRASRNLSRAVANYLERRRILTPERREEIAHYLRDAFVQRYGLSPATDSDLLMRALYYRVFIADRDRDEQFLERRVTAQAAAPPRESGVTV